MNIVTDTGAILRNPDETKKLGNDIKKLVISVIRFLILLGVGYVIVSPIIGMVVNSISSTRDAIDPMIFIFPKSPTLEKYKLVIERLDYFKTIARDLLYTVSLTLIQLFVCSLVGYGFARFNFKFKGLLFGCVVIMIVIPTHTLMLPWYMTFKGMNLMGTTIPMYLMSVLGCGVRSGLYIYIFNQFFRGLPKEIEEAALVDGCGVFYTYFFIMLRNAMPAVITVTVFSLVWQFNDTFYAKLFLISEDVVISKKISSLPAVIANQDKILEPTIQQLYSDAGVLLILLPIVIMYLFLQKYFIEGVERSGIVG